MTPDTCSSGGLLGDFGGQAINDAAKNMAANGAMLGQAAQTAAGMCADLRKTCYEACQAELKDINRSTEYVLYQGHNTEMKYCNGVFGEAQSCLMAVVTQASSVVAQAGSVATQTAAATALTGASALGGGSSGESGLSDSSGGGVSGQQVAVEGCQPDVYKPGCPARTGYEKPGRPVASASTGGSSTNLGGGSSSSIGGQQVAVEGCQPDVYKPGCPARTGYEKPGRPVASATTGSGGSTGLAAAPTTGGGGGRPTGSSGGGGMALTANPGPGGASDPFGSGSGAGTGTGFGPQTGSRSGGRLPSGVGASTTVASAGTNQGLPDNNCDLEEKVFTPACFDIMNDYCTTTQRQGSGCKSFCGTNRSATACAGSK